MGYIGIRVYIGVMAAGFMEVSQKVSQNWFSILRVPRTRIITFWGPYSGSLNWGNCHIGIIAV